jgi:hypothetical protein
LRGHACVLALCLLGCRGEPQGDPLVERAAFGVFFGGQIQDRKELPFELDPSKQSLGIRVDFRQPLSKPVRLSWEIARPLRAKDNKAYAGAGGTTERVTEVGEAAARVGERRLDVPLLLRQGQVLGSWHVRVRVEERTVIERDVLVFDPRELRAREADAGR